MKLCNEKFGNLKAFECHCKPVYIYRTQGAYLVYTHELENGEYAHDWIQSGSLDYINGWLYGAVQTICGQIQRKEGN